ncbi:MAG TPA: hypothetical protein VKQ70_17460 [Caulobacteraceae bacterium]|nr:hypothetical protein [Caulobacteraceae bacterium]
MATTALATPSAPPQQHVFATVQAVDAKDMPAAERLEGACDATLIAIDDLKQTKANAKARSDLQVIRGLVCD